MRELNFNGTDGVRPNGVDRALVTPRRTVPTDSANCAAARKDSVDLSDDARRLLGDSARGRVESARRKLASGELFTPQVLAETAERLLASGDLDRLVG